MHDHRMQRVQVIDAQRRATQKLDLVLPRELDPAVGEHVAQRPVLDELGHDAQVGPLDAGADEQHDVGVVELGQEGHLGPELEHPALVELLLDEPLDGHIDALPLAPEHHSVRPQTNLPHEYPQHQTNGEMRESLRPWQWNNKWYLFAEGDLVEVDDPATQVGRREEVVLLELHALSHHRLHLIVVAARPRSDVILASRPL